ncbi:MAG TPA: hypothetical protein VIK69_06100 [Methylophilaceae bacterium]
MTSPNWYERAYDELVDDLNNGVITQSEFDAGMRDLRDELREAAEEEAQAAYDNVMGGW